MIQTFDQAEDILRFCLDQTHVALVVLTGVSGGTLRARSAMMAVTATSSAGYISNGCVDADIIARAGAGEEGDFIYGDGSPYKDIKLPCGGRLEISIFQNPDKEILKQTQANLSARKSTKLNLGTSIIGLEPRLKLRIAGRGAACIALADLATNCGFDVHVQSPERGVWQDSDHLLDPNTPPELSDDNRTAMVCLFHDHDWEAALLQRALDGPAFYIGAMGSIRTHESRRGILTEMGVAKDKIDRIHGPIGLIPAQRDARLLAISILAEIIQSAQGQALL